MMKKSIFIVALAIILSACSSDKPKLIGLDGSNLPPAFSYFPDVPFPDKSYVDMKQTRALGSGELWIGSLVFTAPFDTNSVYDFYISEMPKLKWTEVATVRGEISTMTYVRQERAIQILIEDNGGFFSDESKVTITAIPNKAKGAF